MSKRAGKMFVKGFIQSFFIVLFLLGVGVLSYKLTMHTWKGPDQEAIVAYKEEPVPEKITEPSIDDISRNLIYCYNEETGEIEKLVLEIFHCGRKQLTYITIPVRTEFTMSDTLYKQLILVHPAIPQIIKLSVLTKYFEEDTVFDYGVLLTEELLGIDISYYTVMPKSVYEEMFTQSDQVNGADNRKEDNASDEYPFEVFKEEYIAFLKTLESAEELSTYIEKIYSSLRSNLPVYDKMNYLESYCKTPIENISFDLVKGNNQNSAFILDEELTEQQLAELITDKD